MTTTEKANKAMVELKHLMKNVSTMDGKLVKWMDKPSTVSAKYDDEQEDVLKKAVAAENALDALYRAIALVKVS